jgi:hypothetical protein
MESTRDFSGSRTVTRVTGNGGEDLGAKTQASTAASTTTSLKTSQNGAGR